MVEYRSQNKLKSPDANKTFDIRPTAGICLPNCDHGGKRMIDSCDVLHRGCE